MRAAALSTSNLIGLCGELARGFPDRVFGTPQGKASSDWLAGRMTALGLDVSFQEFSYDVGGDVLTGRNVVGLLEGSDPALKHEYIVVTAHHDSQHDTHEGANDNASGCAAVLAIAQALAKDPPKRSVLFVTFDGEEGIHKNDKYFAGRRGSRHFAANPIVPLAQTAMLVNLDMIGQVHLESGSRKDVYQWASDDVFAKDVLERASKQALRKHERAIDGYPEQPREAQFFTTDAEPLYRLGVPTINFLSGRDLDNHHPKDDLSRIIPSRIAQYTRLAHRCVVEAANHDRTLAEMGIRPGGLMPAFPLVRERKGAGLGIGEEEQLRLDDLSVRLPELRQAAMALATQVAEGKEVSEPTLAALHEQRDALIDQLHRKKKGSAPELAKEIDRLGAVADVIAGAIYLGKIDKKGGYYLQRIPEKLAELMRGAQRLGLDAEIEGVVRESDIRVFTTDVNADRAVFVARRSLGNLSKAIGQAVYAMWQPEEAAKTEASIGSADAGALKAALVQRARDVAGEIGGTEADVKRVAMVRAMLDAQLSGVRGARDQWLVRFARTNSLTEFAEQAEALKLPVGAQARELEAALAADDLDRLERAVLDFYGAVTEVGFGHRLGADELFWLDRERIDALAANAVDEIRGTAEKSTIQAAAGDPAVERLAALSKLVEASLALGSLYRKEGEGLKEGVTLRQVKESLDHTSDAAAQIDPTIAREIEFWSSWMQPFLPLEATAKEQAKLRTRIAQDGLSVIDRMWREVSSEVRRRGGLDAEETASPKIVCELLEKREDTGAKRALELARPVFDAQQALSVLENEPAPTAEKRFSQTVDKLLVLHGEPTLALAAIRDRLQHLSALDGATIGKKEGQRSGPLGIVAIRAGAER